MGTRPTENAATGDRHSTRSQHEHPLEGGDLEHGTAADGVLRLIHLKAYVDGAARAVDRTVLDVGCNDGYGTVMLAAKARRTTGIDVSPHVIEAARARPEAAGIDFEVVAGDRLPFGDGSFELVTAFQVIEHVADVPPFLAELVRVTVPGGTIVLTTPNAAIRLDPGMAPWNPFHVREYTAGQLRDALTPSFDVVQVRGLFAPPAIAAIELARNAAARERARHPRSRPVRWAIDHLPQAVRVRLRRLRSRDGTADAASIADVGVDDLWYAEEQLDDALDLQAVCRSGFTV